MRDAVETADTAEKALSRIESELPEDFPVTIPSAVKAAVKDRLSNLRVP